MNSRLKIFDYFFLTRPVLFFPGWATLLAGYMAASGALTFLSPIFNHYHIEWWNQSVAAGLLVFSCAMGGSFVLNQLKDIQSDKKNNKLFLLGEGYVSSRAGYVESFLLIGLSIIGALFINYRFFAMIVLFIIITGYLYNFPPFAFKNKPVWGLAANMAMGWLAFAMGWSIVKPVNMDLFLASLPFLFFNTALYFLTTLPDVKGDKSSGKVTFPVKYGINFTVILCLLFFILTIAVSLWHKNEYMLVVSILTVPFMVRLAMRRDTASAIVVVKSGIVSFVLLAGCKFPLFLLLLAIIFFFTRFYYKKRFNFDYPNFKGR